MQNTQTQAPIKPKTLWDLSAGETGLILGYEEMSDAALRLMELGLTAHTKLQVIRKSALGGVIQVRLRGCDYCIEQSLARGIWLQ